MIKYIGSKRRIVPHITAAVQALGASSCIDLFAGTTRVGQALKRTGVQVTSNDTASYSEALGRVFIEADGASIDVCGIQDTLHRANALTPVDGYVTETFSRQARYFQEHNARHIDAVLQMIRETSDPFMKNVLRVSLMLAADKVDSTVGLFNAYLKSWAPRSYKEMRLEVPSFIGGNGVVYRADAQAVAGESADAIYIDPPYNQHSYFSNYHVWETLMRDDCPDTYGIARKRIDNKLSHSPFNRKHGAEPALSAVICAVRAPSIVISFSDEGFISKEKIVGMLAEKGYVGVAEIPSKRYVGSQIGIYDPSGNVVGTPGRARNLEYLFICGQTRNGVDAAVHAVEAVVV